MEDAEFNAVMKEAREGDAERLMAVLRAYAAAFIKRAGAPISAHAVDDFAQALWLEIAQRGDTGSKFPWKVRLRFAAKAAWPGFCREQMPLGAVVTEADPVDARDRRRPEVPVPVQAGGSFFEDGGEDVLCTRAAARGPQTGAEGLLWREAITALVEHGAVLSEELAALRFDLEVGQARALIVEAVLTARVVFEELFNGEGRYTLAECEAAQALSSRIF